jgi:hypothetical protein
MLVVRKDIDDAIARGRAIRAERMDGTALVKGLPDLICDAEAKGEQKVTVQVQLALREGFMDECARLKLGCSFSPDHIHVGPIVHMDVAW